MSRFLRMKKKMASVAGTAGGEKIIQAHMGNPGMRLLRLLDGVTEKAMGEKESKELRKTILRFVIKADLLYQEGKLDALRVLPLEKPLMELCRVVAAATAPTRTQRAKFDPSIGQAPERPAAPARNTSGAPSRKVPPRLQLNRKSSNCKLAPQTPRDDGGGNRPLRAAPPPPDQVLLPVTPGPPSTPAPPAFPPPPPGAMEVGGAGGGPAPPGMGGSPPGMGGSPPGMEEGPPPGAPPSWSGVPDGVESKVTSSRGLPLSTRPPPAIPSRPRRCASVQEDLMAIMTAMGPIIPTVATVLDGLMTAKNKTTLSQLLNAFMKPHWLKYFLGVPVSSGVDNKERCANERQMAFLLCSKWHAQMKVRQKSRNERLRVASFAGDLAEVEAMIQAGAEVNAVRDDLTTPLWFAAAKGRIATVKILLQHGADPTLADKDGALPIMLAAQEGHLEIVKLLVDSEMVPEQAASATTMATLIYIAARKGHADLLEYLLSKHAAILSVPTPRHDKAASDKKKATPIELALTLAIQQGHIDLVNILLKYGCSIEVAVSHGITPVLVSAAQSGSEAMVELLLEFANADVNAVDKAGISPLAEAAECGNMTIGRMLLEHGADPNLSGHEDGMSPLLLVSQSGKNDFITLLLMSNTETNIEARDSIGSTSLMLAAQQGHGSTVDLLLKNGADPNAVDNDGTTALFFAAQEGFAKIVGTLLDKGANPNICDNHGAGPLLVAVQEGHYGIVKRLIDFEGFDENSGDVLKTDVNAARTDGITPIFTAAYLGREQELVLLIEAGADPNPPTAADVSDPQQAAALMEDTPLCGAIVKGHANVVRLLIDAGANVNAKPRKSDNLTPFTLARTTEHAEIIQILIEAGANTKVHGGDASALAPPHPVRPSTPTFSPPAGIDEDNFGADNIVEVTGEEDPNDQGYDDDLACAKSMKIAAMRAKSSFAIAKLKQEEAAAEVAQAEQEMRKESSSDVQLRVTKSKANLKKAMEDVAETEERSRVAQEAMEHAAKAKIEAEAAQAEEEKLRAKREAEAAQRRKEEAEQKEREARDLAAAEEAAEAEARAKAAAEAEAARIQAEKEAAAAEEARKKAEAEAAAKAAAAAEAKRLREEQEARERAERERREAEEARIRAQQIVLVEKLRTAYYSIKKSELFQGIMSHYGGANSEEKTSAEASEDTKQNALRVIASFRVGSPMDQEKKEESATGTSKFADARVIEDANGLLERLESIVDEIDSKAPKASGGLYAVTDGNKLLTKALALHGLMQGEIDALQAALASEEARAAAEAEAAARGMPAALHWTNEDYQLRKELALEEVPRELFYAPEEAAEVTSQSWMFVPSISGGTGNLYEPGKVFSLEGEGDDSKNVEVLTLSDTIVLVERATLKVLSTQRIVDGTESEPIKAAKDAVAFPLSHPNTLKEVPNDLMKIENVNEASVLHTLHARFKRDRCYTSVGPILVSVNPFKWIDGLYGKDIIQYFVDSRFAYDAKRKRHAETPPHTFAVAERAFIALAAGDTSGDLSAVQNQSILVSGESGAGKSEVAKQCLAYLAAVSMPRRTEKATADNASSRFARSKDRRADAQHNMLMMGANGGGVSSAVVDSIVSAVPILEAYGNSKTVRNDNSSRFGKWLLIHFDSNHSILGCSNVSYLLEKTRVVGQEAGERNYHIFYYLLVGAPKEMKQELKIDLGGDSTVAELCCEPFYYVNNGSGTFTTPKSDLKRFQQLQNSFVTLGFSDNEVKSLHQIVAGLLHLGNVRFQAKSDNSDASEIVESDEKVSEAIANASKFLGVQSGLMGDALTTMALEVGGQKVKKDLTHSAAVVNRDSAAKAVYSKLFDWLVETINDKCGDPESEHLRANYIGILDIFGFEIFETNGFEQLCINYANECLQQQFNTDTFKTETAIYAQEGVANLVGDISFADNQDILDIIGGKGGVLRMLDEEVKFGTRGSSESFFKKMCKAHAKPEPKKGKTSKDLITTKAHSSWFKVRHFAGTVQYESNSFLEKNKDSLNQDIVDLLANSEDPLVKLLFTPKETVEEVESKSSRRGKKSAKTVSSQFRASLNQLMKSIKSTETHYIRCIKSNQLKTPNTFHASYVLNQLRTGGVFSAADIRAKGFPFRKSHQNFALHFGMLAYDMDTVDPIPASDADGEAFKAWCTATVKTLADNASNPDFKKQIIVGSSMVLYQSAVNFDLEALRSSVMEKAANVCQGVATGSSDASPDEQKKAFGVFDPTKRGALKLSEIEHLMTNLGEKVSSDVLDQFIAKMPVDKNDCIAISQLCS